MKKAELENLVKEIVEQANVLKNKHTEHKNAPVNYACIFSQSESEYKELLSATKEIGKVITETPTGFLFHIKPVQTVGGELKLLKIRIIDPTRPERGDADFTIDDFKEFEDKYLPKENFIRMDKKDFYMIELMDKEFNVRAYFSNPPLDKELGIE